MRIIESIDELNELKEKLETEVSIWYPLWVDNDKHPQNTPISFIFIRTLTDKYIVPQQHTDAISLSNEQIAGLLNTAGEKWVNNTAEQWNRLSPYDDHLLSARPRFLQSCLNFDVIKRLKTSRTWLARYAFL